MARDVSLRKYMYIDFLHTMDTEDLRIFKLNYRLRLTL